MLVDVQRKTCTAGELTEFTFKATSVSFVVKNFTTAPALVCLAEWDDSNAVMVAAQTAENIVSNPDPAAGMARGATATVIVQAEAAGIVEVIRDD